MRTSNLCVLLVFGTTACVGSEHAGPDESDLRGEPHHHFQFQNVRADKLMVGLPGESFYAHEAVPCGLAAGKGANVTAITISGSTAPGNNLKVDFHAGASVCRTIYFRTKSISTTYYTHQVYLEHSDSGTLSANGAVPILFLEGTQEGTSYELSLDMGNMRDNASTKFVGVRADVTVKATGKTPAPWSTLQKMSFTN